MKIELTADYDSSNTYDPSNVTLRFDTDDKYAIITIELPHRQLRVKKDELRAVLKLLEE